ncbi:MAG: response regulator [Acidobacteriota bacterium]
MMMISSSAQQRILVIDDDVGICKLLARFLGGEGFEVETVHNGEFGIEAVRSGVHALILLDIVLPGIDGFEVLRRIREQSSVPVILMSGTHEEEANRAIGQGGSADGFLSKPFSLSELLERIHASLN